MVDRKHARTHGLTGGGGKRLRLYKQIDDVDGAKLWFPQKADKGDKIAFFHIVKKLASEAEFLEYQSKAPCEVEAPGMPLHSSVSDVMAVKLRYIA